MTTREDYRLTPNLLQAQRQSEHAVRLLEDAVLRALHQLALEKQSYVRTAVIAGRLELQEQLPGPRNSTYAATVVLAICRRLHERGLVKIGRPEGANHHGDKTTGWMIGNGEYQRRQAAARAAKNGQAAGGG